MPYWRVQLTGDQADVNFLLARFPTGNPRIEQDERGVYLLADEFEELEGAGDVRETGIQLLAQLNGLARLEHLNHEPAEMGHVEQIDEDGNRRLFVQQTGSLRIRSVVNVAIMRTDGTVEEPEAERPEWRATVVSEHEHLADALTIFGGDDLDWMNLYKVFEIVRRQAGGGQASKLASKGWATLDELNQFNRTANWHENPNGRHAVPGGREPDPPMSLPGARQLIRRLLRGWIDELQEG